MSDTPETETPQAPAPTPAAPEAADPKPTETVEFWKQKAREQEAHAKANAEKALAHDAFVESQKTEAQRLADAAAAAKREADEARAIAARYKVAATHGVGPEYIDLLGDGDEATIESRAQAISPLLKLRQEFEQLKAENEALKAGKAPALVRPVVDLKPGASPQPEPTVDTSYPSSWLPQSRQSN